VKILTEKRYYKRLSALQGAVLNISDKQQDSFTVSKRKIYKKRLENFKKNNTFLKWQDKEFMNTKLSA